MCDSKAKLAKDLIGLICKHSSAEEQFLYPMFRDKLQNGKSIYDRARCDDQLNKELMQLVLNLCPKRDGLLYDNTVRKLKTIILEHAEQEEEWFSELRIKASKDELVKLEHDLRYAEETGPILPHPAGPSSEWGARIMHPIAAVVDSMMDKTQEKIKEARDKIKDQADKMSSPSD